MNCTTYAVLSQLICHTGPWAIHETSHRKYTRLGPVCQFLPPYMQLCQHTVLTIFTQVQLCTHIYVLCVSRNNLRREVSYLIAW